VGVPLALALKGRRPGLTVAYEEEIEAFEEEYAVPFLEDLNQRITVPSPYGYGATPIEALDDLEDFLPGTFEACRRAGTVAEGCGEILMYPFRYLMQGQESLLNVGPDA